MQFLHTKLTRQYVVLTLIFLVVSTVLISNLLREPFLDHVWRHDRDDPNHIGIAYNFWQDKSFSRNFLGQGIYHYQVDEIPVKYSEIMIDQGGKGPIYYMVLGSFYEITNPHPQDLFLFASILNTILSSVFIVLYFLLFYKKFNFKIAFLSSFVVVLLPYFEWMAIRTLPIALLGLFSLCALFFLKKRTTDYFLFGIFAGLAHLTHPFGIFLGVSYSFYLLLQKEFKGFLIVSVTWVGLLTPWFVRNYYLFKNIGSGLYIPFSGTLSKIFSFLPTKTDIVFEENYLFPIANIQDVVLNPFYVVIGAFNNFGTLYGMGPLILIILLGTGLAFFNFEKFKNNFSRRTVFKTLIFFSIIVISYIIAFSYVSKVTIGDEPILRYTSNIIAFSMILGIPVILSFIIFKTKRTIFNKIPRFYLFVLVFALINLLGYFYTAYWFHRVVPETRQLMFLIFLLVPISLAGLISVMTKLCTHIPYSNHAYSLLPKFRDKVGVKNLGFMLVIIVLIPASFQLVDGLIFFINYPLAIPESNAIVQTNRFLVNNIPPDSNVMSNKPSTTFLRTGLPSVAIIPHEYNIDQTISLIDHFDVRYLVFYHVNSIHFDHASRLAEVSTVMFPKFQFNEIFRHQDSFVFEISPLTDGFIQSKANYYIETNNYDLFLSSFGIVVDFYNQKISDSKNNENYADAMKYENSLNEYISKQKTMLFDMIQTNHDKIKSITNVNDYSDFVDEYMNLQYLLSVTSQKYSDTGFDFEAELTLEKNNMLQHLIDANEIIRENSQQKIKKLFSESKDKESLDYYYETKQILETHLRIVDSQSKDMLYDKLVQYMHDQGKLLFELNRYGDAETVYLHILDKDKFDGNAWLQLGKIYELQDDHAKALHAYGMAERLLQIDLSDKISELEGN